MEYRDIRYTIRAGIERSRWTVTIHPTGAKTAEKIITGPRQKAELLAQSMIDTWLSEQRTRSNLTGGI
jgi:hypothetical protein